MNSRNPLVSVVVVTYKSSGTVIETLESVKSQTYQNIELIITDDNSPDNTLEVCNTWLKINGSRFVNSIIVTAPQNTGVSENINRGIRASHGKWIKSIAGDDLLIPSAIEEYIEYSENSSEPVRMCVSGVNCFSSDGIIPERLQRIFDKYLELSQEAYERQYLRVLQGNIFTGPTFFYLRELYDEIGGFPMEYGNGEEWPFVYKVIKNGNRIYAIGKKLVNYRYSQNSLSHFINSNGLSGKALELSTCHFFFDYPYRDLINDGHYLIAWDRYLYYKARLLYLSKEDSKWRYFFMKYSKFLSPYGYLKRIKLLCFCEKS